MHYRGKEAIQKPILCGAHVSKPPLLSCVFFCKIHSHCPRWHNTETRNRLDNNYRQSRQYSLRGIYIYTCFRTYNIQRDCGGNSSDEIQTWYHAKHISYYGDGIHRLHYSNSCASFRRNPLAPAGTASFCKLIAESCSSVLVRPIIL